MPRFAAALALFAAIALSPLSGLGAADGQYTVRLEAIAHAGGAPIADRMIVKIWTRNGTRTGGKVVELSELPAKIALTPGEYRVLAVHGTVRRVQDIEVGLGGRTVLDLAAGDVELLLRDGGGAAELSGPVVWSIHQYKRGRGVGAHIVDVTGEPARVRLTAGYYDVVAAHAGTRVKHVIEVIAGQVTDYTLVKR